MTSSAELKAARSAEKVVERAEADAKPLAREVLQKFMLVFASVATAFQPGSRKEPNAASDPAKFERYSRLAVDCAKALIAYETPRPVASPLPPIEFQASVNVTNNVAMGADFDFSRLTNEQLVHYYRARVSGASHEEIIAGMPSPNAAPGLPAPSAESCAGKASMPPPTVSHAPIEAGPEGEELEPIVGDPPEAAPTAEPVAYAANVVGQITPELVQRALVPPSVLEHSRSIAASEGGPQGYGAHQGNPEAGRPIDPAEMLARAMRHPAAPRTPGVFDWRK